MKKEVSIYYIALGGDNMAYIEGKDRNQFLIKSLDNMVSETSIVRVIDAFV